MSSLFWRRRWARHGTICTDCLKDPAHLLSSVLLLLLGLGLLIAFCQRQLKLATLLELRIVKYLAFWILGYY